MTKENWLRPPLSRQSGTSSKNKPQVQLQPLTESQHTSQLASQRLSRPVSPHLAIYQPQITWYSGALMRNCAILLTGPIYIFGAAYVISPLLGWHLDTESLVAWFSALPVGARLAVKGVWGFAFCFHVVHGLRHLIWDTGMMLSNRQVMVSGWIGLGISALGTVGLIFW
ncbi:succinate dehydrogenase, cytochrome b556 subunit [Cladophialophora bantiana CBS 173.52]|uniref:Succinate dehydrogenase, cytochrome b556 subunit n=1 Tax=Cladophialophora bantiana (strain ATCC 10958 / CBS 173.52 / CDC B-1940 / NIH 8579) TaxID=1442370 RepID=A0A0D2FN31_CLAB1|nr:succinate dehydrogenase, cytochrome b556 subunit [Cladophialophora bantiana CBS 173.52]KIW88122.1 succinate dehydrogenase, cytochrome b556 subunit [Cladophialophora bantiana CBS 173.52]